MIYCWPKNAHDQNSSHFMWSIDLQWDFMRKICAKHEFVKYFNDPIERYVWVAMEFCFCSFFLFIKYWKVWHVKWTRRNTIWNGWMSWPSNDWCIYTDLDIKCIGNCIARLVCRPPKHTNSIWMRFNNVWKIIIFVIVCETNSIKKTIGVCSERIIRKGEKNSWKFHHFERKIDVYQKTTISIWAYEYLCRFSIVCKHNFRCGRYFADSVCQIS